MTQRPALPTLIEQADAAGVALFATTVALPSDGSAPEWVTVFPKTGRVVEAVRDDAPAAGPSLPTAGASRSRQPVRGPSMDGHFSGYASLFHVPDLGRDTVAPGAFAQSLARRGPAGVRMLWQHDPAEPIGLWLSLHEDARGLRVAGRLNLAVQRAREVDALMREGALDGLSIGFRTLRATPERGGRRLVAVDLWEVSLVTFPLQPGARISPAGADLAHRADLADRLRACAGRMRAPHRPFTPARIP